MKKNKLNNKGFVLVETLIVSTFVMSIFSILYNNFYPIMGEYEKREVYDDIDGKYAAFWMKQMIQDSSVSFTATELTPLTSASGRGYIRFTCDKVGDAVKKQMCERIYTSAEIKNVYITTYNLAHFKNWLDEGVDPDTMNFTGGMQKYVAYLPEYKVASLNDAQYRVIVEFHRKKHVGDDNNDYLAYATFEVVK